VTDILALAGNNLLSPMILCFALGLLAALARSDLSVPEAAAKALSLYLLFAIGFKGGAAVADSGLGFSLFSALAAGVLLSVALPFVAFALLRVMTRFSVADAAALLSAMTGIDPTDAASARSNPTLAGQDFTRFLDPGALKGARIGVAPSLSAQRLCLCHRPCPMR
jgi:hypothetical protein